MRRFIEICDGLMMLLDDNGNGYDCHELISYTEAQKQIDQWATELGIGAGDACRQAAKYFSEQEVTEATDFDSALVEPTALPLSGGTRVVSTTDQEPGTIVKAISFDPMLGWYEYEVRTAYGIECWLRSDFVVRSEIEARAR